LFGITVIRYWNSNDRVVIGAAVLGIVGILGLLYYFRQAVTVAPQFITAQSVHPHGSEAMSYIVTYIIPFLEIDLVNTTQQLSFLLLFVVIGLVYVNSNLIYINPILTLFGYNTFEVTPTDGITRMLLTKRSFIRPEDRLRVAKIGDYLFLEKEGHK
jgi:hypothetical protein